jgi:hypothetical protein
MTRNVREYKATRIAELADAGLTHREIAEIVDSTVKAVSVTLCNLRNGYGRKNRKAMVVRIDPTCRDALAVEAKRRRIREQDLATQIIEAVVRDGLFGAVFDDDPDT